MAYDASDLDRTDSVLRSAVDRKFAALLDSLPLGWEVSIYKAQQAILAAAQEAHTMPIDSNEAYITEEQLAADLSTPVEVTQSEAELEAQAAKEQDEAVAKQLRAAIYDLLTRHPDSRRTLYGRGDVWLGDYSLKFVFPEANKTFTISVSESKVHSYEWQRFVLATALERGHQPSEFTSNYKTGDSFSTCERCYNSTVIPKDGIPRGTMHNTHCACGPTAK